MLFCTRYLVAHIPDITNQKKNDRKKIEIRLDTTQSLTFNQFEIWWYICMFIAYMWAVEIDSDFWFPY